MPIFCSKCGKENRDASKFCNICATSLQISTPSGPLQKGTILENRYKVIELIKAGGMGAVYKALDIKFDSICAIKELLPPYGATPQQEAQSAEWFKREAKLLNTLHHTNLPKVSDYFVNYGRYYLVMTFVEGEDLEIILARDGKPELPAEKVVEWVTDVLQVLEYIHNQKPPIVYRDIKPGNIMIHKDGKAMLIDFGIARVVQESSQTKKTAIGTQGYAPPEQCRGQVEPRSDLYALGATMHHLLTGIEPLPFRFEPLRKINFKISTELENIVMTALKDNLHERFSSAKEMKEALVNLSIPLQIKAKPQPVIMPSQINQIVPPTKDLYRASPIQKSFIEPEMVYINGGTFKMGSNNGNSNEKPIHSVTVGSFYMGKYEVTNREFCLFDSSHNNHRDNLPVVEVSWDDVAGYCRWLSAKTGKNYRLPTESEWEYACRAESNTEYYWGNNMDGNYCWYSDNSGSHVHPVGEKIPNKFGLYDMSGNVWEWCSDLYGDYPFGSVTNPTGPKSGSLRVIRGGGWVSYASICRSAFRSGSSLGSRNGGIGFRLLRSAP